MTAVATDVDIAVVLGKNNSEAMPAACHRWVNCDALLRVWFGACLVELDGVEIRSDC